MPAPHPHRSIKQALDPDMSTQLLIPGRIGFVIAPSTPNPALFWVSEGFYQFTAIAFPGLAQHATRVQ